MNKRLIRASAVALLLGSFNAFAQPGMQGQGERRGPPEEAFTACENKAVGDSCSVITPHGDEVNGSCGMPRGERLVCIPDNPPPGHPEGRGSENRSPE